MPRAVSVAKELVRLSYEGDEADPLTNLRLQKLLYYAQAWSLIVRGGELFPETLEAWRRGPVVVEVYQELAGDHSTNQISPVAFANQADLPGDVADFVRRVWDAYKRHSATQLSEMSHNETPWQNAWGNRPKNGIGNDPILVEDMETYFSTQDMPGPLAQYEHELRKAEEYACRVLATLPQLDAESLAAIAIPCSPLIHQ